MVYIFDYKRRYNHGYGRQQCFGIVLGTLLIFFLLAGVGSAATTTYKWVFNTTNESWVFSNSSCGTSCTVSSGVNISDGAPPGSLAANISVNTSSSRYAATSWRSPNFTWNNGTPDSAALNFSFKVAIFNETGINNYSIFLKDPDDNVKQIYPITTFNETGSWGNFSNNSINATYFSKSGNYSLLLNASLNTTWDDSDNNTPGIVEVRWDNPNITLTTLPPNVISNTNNQYVKTGDNVSLSATITATAGVRNATVNVSAINSTIGQAVLNNVSGLWINNSIIADKPDTNGLMNLTITAYNNAGDVNNSINMTVGIDDTPPSVTSNTNNIYVLNGSAPSLNATITDLGAGVKNATVNISAINSTINEAILNNVSGFWINNSITADKVTGGFVNLTITAYDNAGNVNNGTNMTVKVDPVRAVSLSNISVLAHSTPAGTNATYVLNFTNNGSDPDSYTLAVDNPEGASVSGLNVSSPVFLNASSTSIFSLNVTNASSGIFHVNVTAVSVNDSNRFSYINTTTTVTAPGAPNLTSFAPQSPVNDVAGASRTFNITTNQTVNMTWYINGTFVQFNESVTDANYTNISAVAGFWNVTAIANNTNGTAFQTWNWSVTSPTPTPAQPSGGGGGGGCTGGGVITTEPYTNIEKAERYDKDFIANTSVIYTFKAPELGVYEIAVTDEQNENCKAIRVEALKGTSKLVTISPPGAVYKNVNIWAGTKSIKEALIRFKVENSWLSSNSLATSDVKMVKWDGSKWAQLVTVEKTKDSAFTYFEAKTDTFSVFAITGLSGSEVPTATPVGVVTETPVKPTGTAAPAPAKQGIPWFEVIMAIAAIALLIASLNKHRKRR
ncbi:MAG: PGF-pre-PGF domain-containing protein [Candidatus Methanoperedens sp.]|nr:PGF-pre-PGF domain-containing protein [Candidatus Methanoperedens sp.]MCZ7404585.1 PGF-pre-PGF domain-containing protein [Candidatus Methanoperedens sp.]